MEEVFRVLRSIKDSEDREPIQETGNDEQNTEPLVLSLQPRKEGQRGNEKMDIKTIT